MLVNKSVDSLAVKVICCVKKSDKVYNVARAV